MPRRNLLTILVACAVSLISYERASRNRYGDLFAEVVNIVSQRYVEPVAQRALFDDAISGMMEGLDRHSTFYPPRKLAAFNEDLDQEFPGIGIEVTLDEESAAPMVNRVLPGTPARRAGLLPGDIIVAIEGQSTRGLSLEASVKLMRGPLGEDVTLTVRHAGADQDIDLVITRDRIETESVLGDFRGKDEKWRYYLQGHPEIGYIRVRTFGARTVEELYDALDYGDHPVEALILDLRDNPGGLLPAAVATCELFLDEGLIVRIVGRSPGVTRQFDAHPRNKKQLPPKLQTTLPMVILVNEYSASASEIVAACLKDHGRAVIVGERTYGKGSVQNVIEIEGGASALKLTTAYYQRPNGHNIHRREGAAEEDEWGVRPSKGFEVKIDNELRRKLALQRFNRDSPPAVRANDEAPAVDPQLEKAVECLKARLAGNRKA